MKSFFLAVRPKTLIASISPVLIGSALVYNRGKFDWSIFLATLLTGILIQISTNFANDLFDYIKGADTPSRKGPVRVTASGLISVMHMKWLTFTLIALCALCSTTLILRGGWIIALLTLLALLLALGYTTGPFPLAYLGIAEIFILIFFGPVATSMTAYLQTLSLNTSSFTAGCGPGLLACSLLVVNNLRDLEEDRKAHKRTLVVRFGSQFGKWEYIVAVTLGCFTPLFFLKENSLFLWGSLICMTQAIPLCLKVYQTTDPADYNPLLAKTGHLLLVYTLIFVLIKAL